MKSLKAIVDEVKIDLKQFTDDSRLEYLDEFIMAKCDDIRATLIRQDIDNRKGYASLDFYTPICCIEIKCEEQSCTLEGVTIPSGTVLWSASLPPLIEDIGEYDLKYLGLDNYDKPFTRVSISGFQNVIGDIWNNTTYWLKIGNKVYFKNLPSSGIKYVCAIGLWQSPETLCNYDYATTMYPVPSDYQLKVLLKRDILTSWGYIVDDKFPNAKDDSIIPPAAAKANQPRQDEQE